MKGKVHSNEKYNKKHVLLIKLIWSLDGGRSFIRDSTLIPALFMLNIFD